MGNPLPLFAIVGVPAEQIAMTQTRRHEFVVADELLTVEEGIVADRWQIVCAPQRAPRDRVGVQAGDVLDLLSALGVHQVFLVASGMLRLDNLQKALNVPSHRLGDFLDFDDVVGHFVRLSKSKCDRLRIAVEASVREADFELLPEYLDSLVVTDVEQEQEAARGLGMCVAIFEVTADPAETAQQLADTLINSLAMISPLASCHCAASDPRP